jgi:hypothetical protein
MNCGNLSFTIRWCLAVSALLCAAVAKAAPPAAGLDARTASAIQWNDELKTRAATLPKDSFMRRMALQSSAAYDYLLGRKAAFVRYQEEREAEAAAAADPEERIGILRVVARDWAIVEPARARRLLERIEREIESLPADKRDLWKHNLADVYFELGDDDKAVACAQSRVGDSGAVNSYCTLLSYRQMARYYLEQGPAEPLQKLRNKIRKFEADPADLDPRWKIHIDTEQHRVEALAVAGLPDEAVALYDFCRSTGISDNDHLSGLTYICRAYARAGKRDEAKAFLRKHVSHIKADRKYRVALAAAHAGDYALVDESLAEGEPPDILLELRAVIMAAHRRGDVKQRDALLNRYRDALSRLPNGQADANGMPYDTAAVEAAMGRNDAAPANLPNLPVEQACALRDMVIDLILHEQGKTFGRLAYSHADIYMGDF